ncbi:hypothetical protein [Nonomuraea basaltis]|uniref:hypothetical protein n=1 Tax=Nonomuraea basaltis TaxID=2495887 RepID=UPI00110C6EDB|nr:hypothetical protein [Nonomuraea basaltis]TMR98339.1 hypothetical protein EJK15_13400 [Nonomuraea basaltis]
MILDTPYASVRQEDGADQQAAGRREGASAWQTLAAGQAPHEQHPDAPDADPNVLARGLLPRTAAGAAELAFRPLVQGFFPPARGWFAPMRLSTASTSMDGAGSEAA